MASGLYDPRYEHDACGVAFVARLHGPASHEIVERGIVAIENLFHRGATGADSDTGDGAGLLLQMPDELYRGEVDGLRRAGRYGLARVFLPADAERAAAQQRLLEQAVEGEGQRILGWRDVPVDQARCGTSAREVA